MSKITAIIIGLVISCVLLVNYFFFKADLLELKPLIGIQINFLGISILIYSLSFLLISKILKTNKNLILFQLAPFFLTFIGNVFISEILFLKDIGYLENADLIHFSNLIALSLGSLVFIFLTCFFLGCFFGRNNEITPIEVLKKLSLGIIHITTILILIGIPGWLDSKIIWGLFGIIWIAYLVQNFKTKFEESLKILKFKIYVGYWGHFSFWILSVFLSVNFLENLRPVPKGYDAMYLYSNLSFLIHDYGSLVKGFGAYNYSLFNSLPLFLFGNAEYSLIINFGFVFLGLLMFIVLARKILGLNQSLLISASLFSIPMLNKMTFMQHKVESMLMFFGLLLIYHFIEAIQIKLDRSKIISIGLIGGFLIGIKFTSIIFILSFFIGIWFLRFKIPGLLFSSFGTLLLLFLLNFDRYSGLDFYHQKNYWFWVLLVLPTLVLAIYLTVKNRNEFWDLIKNNAIIGFIALTTFSPWMVKNFNESGNFNLTSLIFGKNENVIQ